MTFGKEENPITLNIFSYITQEWRLIVLSYSFGADKVESQVHDDIDWELILPQEILRGTQCTISEEERLFIESFFS